MGRWPVLLLSRNPAYAYLNKVLVAEVTTTIRGIPQEVTVGRPEGLPSASVVNLDNLHTVAKRRLTKRAGSLRPTREIEIKRARSCTRLDRAERVMRAPSAGCSLRGRSSTSPFRTTEGPRTEQGS